MKEEISKKTLWGFSTSCTGRDLTYTLVSLFFITFVQYTCKLTTAQFSILSLIIILCRVWDAINDPMMSTIITNTRSKKGRYAPWVLIGSITNSIFLVGLFLSPGFSGWNYVVYLGICYLLWGMTYTMNDVSYWSLIPHLARSKNLRDKVTGLVAIFASVGQFITGGLIPILTTGNMINVYRIYAIVVAIIFVASQIMVYFTLEENDSDNHQTNIKFKEMFKIIFGNKQLLVMTAVILMYSFSSALLTSFGTNYFYFKLGYEGGFITIFTVVFAVGTLTSQIAFGSLIKRFTRAELIKYSTLITIVGYVIFFGLANIPLSWLGGNKMLFLGILCVIGLIIFAAQGLHYLVILIMLTNTIEYGEWQTGVRNEAITFSVRPFMVKLASAIQQGALSLTLVVSGLYAITKKLSELEAYKSTNPETNIIEQANSILATANATQIFVITIGMCLIPAIMFLGEYILIKKKYIIDEKLYDKMLVEINERSNKITG